MYRRSEILTTSENRMHRGRLADYVSSSDSNFVHGGKVTVRKLERRKNGTAMGDDASRNSFHFVIKTAKEVNYLSFKILTRGVRRNSHGALFPKSSSRITRTKSYKLSAPGIFTRRGFNAVPCDPSEGA